MNNLQGKLNIFLPGIALLCLCFLLSPNAAAAASYDLYVDSSYSGTKDGTKDKPFDKLSQALDAGNSKSKIFIKKGTYTEKIVISKGVSLHGENRNKVFLSGGIEMKDNSSIANLTVTGGATAVLIDANASIVIDNCNIKKFGKIGVDALPGNGKVVIKNSSIYGGSGKGLYIELGRKVEISKNAIYGNGEEGIDVRAGVNGFIKNNDLHDNGESGIEIILGSSDVLISANTIKKNGASGIAAQFYQERKKIGEISIANNTITQNKKYGLDCNFPSGGNPTAAYWNDSINLAGNRLESNHISPINDFCHIADGLAKNNGATDETAEKDPSTDTAAALDEASRGKAATSSKCPGATEAKITTPLKRINTADTFPAFPSGIGSGSLAFLRHGLAMSRKPADTPKNNLGQLENTEIKNDRHSSIEKSRGTLTTLTVLVQEKETVPNWFLELLKLS